MVDPIAQAHQPKPGIGEAGSAHCRRWLVFNGDADGICAAHQLRLAGSAPHHVVTGVKRDIGLLAQVAARAGDQVEVADISLDANRAALDRLLAAGACVTWYDHHFAGAIPASAALKAHIDTASDTCSSLIVDALLGGRFRKWAVTAAFGDNLHAVAHKLAETAALDAAATQALRELGELMNYNAYGETVQDLYVAPADLFARIAQFDDPLQFAGADAFVPRLRAGMAADLRLAHGIAPLAADAATAVLVLPALPWARRVNGVFANELARAHPERAHAILVQSAGGFVVSVRAPLARPSGADTLCRGFATGGGRARAAGINDLPQGDLERFCQAFRTAFAGSVKNGEFAEINPYWVQVDGT